jgi:hypothetical protein
MAIALFEKVYIFILQSFYFEHSSDEHQTIMRFVAHPRTEDCMLEFVGHLQFFCTTILSSDVTADGLDPLGCCQYSGYP